MPDSQLKPVHAYVYEGQWVADCPAGCGSVEFLYTQSRMNGPRDVRRTFFQCSYCGYASDHMVWPRREHEIMQVLMLRPVPRNRNWYPKDHPVALQFRIPHGQTPDDLRAENEEHGVK